MRTFVALDLEEQIHGQICRFIEGLRELAPDAHWVNSESLHVTLKFIGEKPETTVKEIEAALSGIREKPFQLSFRGCGFFPTRKTARIFWAGIESQQLAGLVKSVEEALEKIGIPREERAYSPHLTLARAGGGSGAPRWQKGDRQNRKFERLQERFAQSPAPDFGTMTARDFFLYRSELGRGGPRYTKIARFNLPSAEQ